MKIKLITALLAALCVCSCGDGAEINTPLGWCINEVMSNYATEYPYSYSKIKYPKGFYDYDHVKDYSFVDCYEVHVFVNDPAIWATDYYYCGVAYSNSTKTYYKRSEVEVDYDFLYRINFEELL